MVLKGLRVGDTFEDGGRAYRVLSVNADGTYFSKAIAKVDTKEEVVVEEKKYTKTEINRMAKDDLLELAKKYGVEAETATEIKKLLIEKMNI